VGKRTIMTTTKKIKAGDRVWVKGEEAYPTEIVEAHYQPKLRKTLYVINGHEGTFFERSEFYVEGEQRPTWELPTTD
jgi:hypothetical protein